MKEATKDEKQKERKLYLEMLRMIAAFFVIFNHAGERGYLLFYQYPSNQLQFWIYQMFSVLCKVAVPVFFMISGALLISKGDTLKRLWLKRIARIVLILVVYSAFYYMADIHKSGEMFSIKHFFVVLYEASWNGPFWFLYAYIAFLICLPFIAMIAKALDAVLFRYLIGLALLFSGILPCVEYILFRGEHCLNEHLQIAWLIQVSVLYPIVGYYLDQKIEIQKICNCINAVIGFGGTILTAFVSCFMTWFMMRQSPEMTSVPQNFVDCFVLVHAVTLFLTAKALFAKEGILSNKLPEWSKKLFIEVGSCTFGIFLMHMFFINSSFMMNLWDRAALKIAHGHLILSFLYCGLIAFLCTVITFVMRRIPWIRSLV